MSQNIAVGLLGAGMIGTEHAKYLQIAHGVELVAVADPTPAGQKIAEQYGVAHYEDYEQLLDSGTVGAVIVALPNAMHEEATVAAVQRGVAVLVEKPIAHTLDSARRMVEAADQHEGVVLVGHQRRYAADISAAKTFIDDGELGEIVSVAVLSTWRKDEPYFEAPWRSQPGGGPILINLIHDIDVIRYLVGEIEQVAGIGSSKQRGFPVADTAGVLMRFAQGAIGTALVSDAAVSPWNWDLVSGYGAYFPEPPPAGDVYFISGTKAAISLPSLRVFRYEEGGHWQTPMTSEILERTERQVYVEQLEHLGAVARGEAEPIISALDASRTLAVAHAIDEALSGTSLTEVAGL